MAKLCPYKNNWRVHINGAPVTVALPLEMAKEALDKFKAINPERTYYLSPTTQETTHAS